MKIIGFHNYNSGKIPSPIALNQQYTKDSYTSRAVFGSRSKMPLKQKTLIFLVSLSLVTLSLEQLTYPVGLTSFLKGQKKNRPITSKLNENNPKAYTAAAKNLRSVANTLIADKAEKIEKKEENLSDVAILQEIIAKAADYSGDNGELFLKLMNEVFFTSLPPKRNYWIQKANVPKATLADEKSIELGGEGLHRIYQDGDIRQLSLHFWFFVNAGYHNRMELAWPAAVYHEWFDEKKGRSENDYRLSILGIEIGRQLLNKKLNPQLIAENIEPWLTTDKYDQILEWSPLTWTMPKK